MFGGGTYNIYIYIYMIVYLFVYIYIPVFLYSFISIYACLPLSLFFDRNMDGTIDRAEFEIGLASVSAPRVPCAGAVARLFSQVDVDELGFISMGRMCDLFGVY